MSDLQVKVPDIGDFKDVPVIEIFVGAYDEFRIYNVALSPSQIGFSYSNGPNASIDSFPVQISAQPASATVTEGGTATCKADESEMGPTQDTSMSPVDLSVSDHVPFNVLLSSDNVKLKMSRLWYLPGAGVGFTS